MSFHLITGDAPFPGSERAVYTPLIKKPGVHYYTLSLDHITVDKTTVAVTPVRCVEEKKVKLAHKEACITTHAVSGPHHSGQDDNGGDTVVLCLGEREREYVREREVCCTHAHRHTLMTSKPIHITSHPPTGHLRKRLWLSVGQWHDLHLPPHSCFQFLL